MTDTKGYICFGIKTKNGALNEDDFEQHLGIKSTKFEKMFSQGPGPECTIWTYSTGVLRNPIYFQQIEHLITKLIPYKGNLKKFKEAYPEVDYRLEIVIFLGDEIPGLSFNLKVLSFLN